MPDVEANYNIPLDHPSVEGHFPGNPVIPGVVILEKVLQTIAQQKESSNYKIVMAKFTQPLIPPATLTVHLSNTTENRVNFTAMVNTDVIAKGMIEIRSEHHV